MVGARELTGDGSAAIMLYTITSDTQQQYAEARLDRFAVDMGMAVDRVLALARGGPELIVE
jgi:hypothetical protein